MASIRNSQGRESPVEQGLGASTLLLPSCSLFFWPIWRANGRKYRAETHPSASRSDKRVKRSSGTTSREGRTNGQHMQRTSTPQNTGHTSWGPWDVLRGTCLHVENCDSPLSPADLHGVWGVYIPIHPPYVTSQTQKRVRKLPCTAERPERGSAGRGSSAQAQAFHYEQTHRGST